MTPHNAWMIYYYAVQIFVVLCIVHPMSTLSTKRENTSVCDEGSMKSDPKDCASYFQCLDGQIVNQKCHNGSYFDAAWEVCVIDALGVCKPRNGNCTEGALEQSPKNSCGYLKCWNGILVEVNCTSGNYFNSTLKTCLIDMYGVCSNNSQKCTEGEMKVNPADPCGYLKCWNGILVKVNCTSGNYFNSTLKTCLIDMNGVCSNYSQKCTEGEMKVNPEDPCGYLRCVNGSLSKVNCPNGSYFNSTLMICLIDENGVCSAIPGNCTEGELKGNPEDPCGYLRCTNGSLAEMNCPNGSYFNSTLKICLIDEHGICSAIPGNCTEGELKGNPEDPCGYLRCINGSLAELNCPSGSYFNSTLKICLVDEDGICSAIPGNCTEGELKSNPEDPCGYLRCTNGSLAEQNCPSGSYFNSTLKICLVDEDGICSAIPGNCTEGELKGNPEDPCGYLRCINGSLAELNCTSGSYFNSTLNICLVDEDGVCSAIPGNCTEGELKGNPEDPCGYFRCINGSLAEVSCADGSYFNSTLMTCLIDESGVCSSIRGSCIEGQIEQDPDECGGYLQCINGEMMNQLCSYGHYFHTILKSCVVDNDGICTSLIDNCKEGDRHADPEDCTSYLECINGDFVSQKCAEGSYFESSILACIVDENCVCIPLVD